MTIKDIVKWRYKGILPLEATCIAGAIKSREWKDFTHSLADRIVFTIVSFFCKTY